MNEALELKCEYALEGVLDAKVALMEMTWSMERDQMYVLYLYERMVKAFMAWVML